jgi:hypothetical protein
MQTPLLDKFGDDGREVSVALIGDTVTQLENDLSVLSTIKGTPDYCPGSFVVICPSIVGMFF